MSNIEIYKDSLVHQRFDFGESKIIRLSRENNSADQYVSSYEGIIDPFIIDQSKISESKATRRLLDKTQVVFNPGSPHIRVRSSHTSEVCSTAKNISDIFDYSTSYRYTHIIFFQNYRYFWFFSKYNF